MNLIKFFSKIKEVKDDMIVKNNWSGDDIKMIRLEKKKKYFRALNRIDIAIWLKGFIGVWIVFKKYVIQALSNEMIGIFFDLCILINTVFLALHGNVSGKIIEQVNNIITILLLFELIMKLISKPLSIFYDY